ncbi:MAG TPA: hypothetical protein VGQ90_05660 [Stellaceae bacterium]|nr:hypothetical protein [Stellaceae bacterium]
MVKRPSWWRRRKAAADPLGGEEVKALAARLGITEERVLEELKRLAFANLKHFFVQGENGVELSADAADEDFAAVAEIVEDAKEHKPYRIKLYDKRPPLEALARVVGLLNAAEPIADKPDEAEPEDPREILKRAMARIAARTAKE